MEQRQQRLGRKRKQKTPLQNKITSSAEKQTKASQLRIVGGQWRSRRLPVVAVQGLRPTPDRVRETLFNWLQLQVPGARCLDLFAGSGALGFEALSREAAEVVLVEKDPLAFAQLQSNAETLQAAHAVLINRDALLYLQEAPGAFDLIFIDPPFHQGLIDQVMRLIIGNQLLKPEGMIYLEYESGLMPDFGLWRATPYRETSAGQVVSTLLYFKS